MDLERSSMPRTKRTPDSGQPCLLCITVIQNTASDIVIENFYPISNIMAEVEEVKCF